MEAHDMSDELKVLARAYADGEITEPQLQRLEFILQGDAEARRQYLEELNLISALEDLSIAAGAPLPARIRETNHIWIIYKIAAVFWLLVATLVVFSSTSGGRLDFTRLEYLVLPAALHFFFIWVLGKITAEVDQSGIKVGMGPFKSKTRIEDIESIRPCTIRPLRDFWGWGWKKRSDGTRGFIGDGNVGVEFIRKDGRRTVVTVSDPERFVDYVCRIRAEKQLDNTVE
jgi:hypothetical protein